MTIRPIRPDDADRLSASHDRLSEETRYRRFLVPKPHLTPSDTRYFVEVDGCRHFALVATRPDLEDEPIVGVARFVRDPADPEVAEMAIVIGDAWQRHGLGSVLTHRLADEARRRGVRRFRATMLSENRGMRRLMQSIAADGVSLEMHGSVLEAEAELASELAPAA